MDVHGEDTSGLESLVIDLYRRHGFDPEEPANPWELARRELGRDCFDRPARVIAGGSGAYRLHGRWRIAIARNLPVAYAAHAVGHELGHVLLSQAGVKVSRAEEERLCNIIGGAIIAPHPAVARLYHAFGLDMRAMARAACASPTWAALRIGEALGLPAAVVTPVRVRTRGPEWWTWPPCEQTIRGMARTSARGVRRTLGPGRLAFFPTERAA